MNILMYINVKSLLIELLIINAICSAILVIISKNPVISVIFLISLVLNSALFLMVKGMPFFRYILYIDISWSHYCIVPIRDNDDQY